MKKLIIISSLLSSLLSYSAHAALAENVLKTIGTVSAATAFLFVKSAGIFSLMSKKPQVINGKALGIYYAIVTGLSAAAVCAASAIVANKALSIPYATFLSHAAKTGAVASTAIAATALIAFCSAILYGVFHHSNDTLQK